MWRIIVVSILCSIFASIISASSNQIDDDTKQVDQVRKNRTRAAKFNNFFWANNVEIPLSSGNRSDQSRAITVAKTEIIKTQLVPTPKNEVAKLRRSNESPARKMKHSGERSLLCLTSLTS